MEKKGYLLLQNGQLYEGVLRGAKKNALAELVFTTSVVGYIAVNPKATDAKRIYAAVCGAGRSLGYVCAPALFQRVAAACDGMTSDLQVYKRNRDLLYNALTAYGFTCVYPDGAFYLFVKAPETDAKAFCERAKKYELLFVAGDDFGCAGWVRVAYCVQTEQIERALPAFAALAKEYGL